MTYRSFRHEIIKQASKLLSGVALTFALINSANASTLDIVGGVLMGATGVDVGGSLYDVTFGDGVVGNNISIFTDKTSATLASQSLIDQVFQGGYVNFINVNGTTQGFADILTIYSTSNVINSRGKIVTQANYVITAVDPINQTYQNRFQSIIATYDLSTLNTATIATWKPSVSATAVPEPEVYAMMLAGLGLVGFAARRKQAV